MFSIELKSGLKQNVRKTISCKPSSSSAKFIMREINCGNRLVKIITWSK